MPDFAARIERLRKLVHKAQIDSLLVTNYTNVSYLTGFTGDDSYLLVRPGGETLITDPRYTQQVEEECPGLEIEIREPGTNMYESVTRVVKAAKLCKLGIEASEMTVAFRELLGNELPAVAFVSTNGLVEELREIKDKEEVDEIREAVRIAEQAFAVIRNSLRPDRTEKAIADELEYQIRLFGGRCSSFPSIIGVGERAALPHGRPTATVRIADSDFVLIDWGARGRLYCSDLTRVLVTGKLSSKLERVYGVVLAAQEAAIAAIRPGAVMKEVDGAARNLIAKAGFGKQFGHSLGHGIGMNVHEQPRLAVDQDRSLKAGMVVTVEPGIYIPGWGGVRIEDDVLVTRTGHEVLTSVPKRLEECLVP
jgi:Xaa-Pro aminopeptidase